MQEMARKQKEMQKFTDLIKEGAGKTVEERVEYNKDLEYNKHANLFAISYSTLHKAACDGSVNGIKYFMQLKTKPRIHIDDLDKFGICPIHYSAERGYDDAIKTMLAFNCPVDVITTDGMTAMMYASKGGKTHTMQLLFDAKANLQATNRSGMSIAHFAAPNDFHEVFSLLIELNRKQKEMILAQIEEAELNAENAPMAAAAGKPASAKAAATPAKAEKAFDSDDEDDDIADADGSLAEQSQSTPIPVDEDISEAERLRLQFKKLLNLPDSSIIDVASKNGTRPLHVAATFNAINVVQFLVTHGADVNAVDSAGETPLHKAARKNNFDSYKCILAHGGHDYVKVRAALVRVDCMLLLIHP